MSCTIKRDHTGEIQTVYAIVGESNAIFGPTTAEDIKIFELICLTGLADDKPVTFDFEWNGYPGWYCKYQSCPKNEDDDPSTVDGTFFIRNITIHQ